MLSGIILCCCWSKLWKVSPCWPAPNPPLMHVVRAGAGAQLGDSQNLFPAFARQLHLLQPFDVSGEDSARAVWQTAERPGCSHRTGKAAALPKRPPFQFCVSEHAGRQTGLTYQLDIVQPRFSCLPQSNENFNGIPLPFFFTYFHRGHELKKNKTLHYSKHKHTHRGQGERVLLIALDL